MKMAQREKFFVLSGGGVTLLLLIYILLIGPAFERSILLDRLILQKTDAIKQIGALKDTYLTQKMALEDINKRLNSNKKNFAILSFLEETARKVGIKENISKMKPFNSTDSELYKESSVELKVDGVKLDQLVKYLYHIENSNRVINVKRLKVKKRSKNRQLFDITFEVSTFELTDPKK